MKIVKALLVLILVLAAVLVLGGFLLSLVLWQERRGVKPVERLWGFYLTGDDFYRELANELAQSKN